MAAQIVRNVLNVFLASPSDRGDERRLAREVIEEINRYIRRLNWHVELLGWEDTLPGFSRPQELINRDVDSCQLFLGILWRRWGQPTGQYDSGFEEEFDRAKRRKLKEGSPEIWISFKEVDSDLLKDPGDQLKRVIAFRKSLEETRDLLFKQFRDTEHWRNLLREWLLNYVIDLYQTTLPVQTVVSAAGSPIPQGPETSQSSQPPPVQDKTPGQPTSGQILETFRLVSTAITEGEFDSRRLIDGKTSGDVFTAARSYLFASSWLSALNTNELLGTHGINLLFVHRERLEIVPVERLLLLRCVIADESEASPGWFWIKNCDTQMTEEILFSRAVYDSNLFVRKAALELLKAAGVPARDTSIGTKDDFIKSVLSDDTQSVLISALDYLASSLNPNDLPLVKTAISENPSAPQDKASETEQLIIVRKGQPAEIAKLIPTLRSESKAAIAELEKRAHDLDDDTLRSTLQHSESSLRALSLKALVRRGQLSTDQLRDLLNDSSSTVKAYAYEELIRHGVAVTPEEIRKALPRTLLSDYLRRPNQDSLIFDLLKSRDYDQLLSMIDWYLVDAPIAYKVLALHHFKNFQERLRRDLQAEFANIRTESIEKLKNTNSQFADLLTKAWSEKNIDALTKSDFIAATLAGLAVNGEQSDATLARSYLNDPSEDVRTEAVRVLYRFGHASDSASLVALSIASWGELQELAAKAALKLAPGVDGAARDLLLSEKPKLVALTIQSISKDDHDKFRDTVEALLQSENTTVRLNGVFYFVKHCQDDELKEMLNRYLAGDTYYYNVVCWLDRILYGPPPLNDTFRRQLETRFSE
jgi:hypothetical protein